MSFLEKLFGRSGADDPILRNGDRVRCGECKKKLKVKYFPLGYSSATGIEDLAGIAMVCQKCGFVTCTVCAMKPQHGLIIACPSCKEVMGPKRFREGVDVPRKPASTKTGLPKAQSTPQPDESWTPVNPQVSSRMPFAALEQIFIFTTGNGESLMKSKVVTGMLQDAACKPLSSMLGKIPTDVIARSDVGVQVTRDGSIPDVAWTAMSAIKPDITREARNGEYRTCVRPFPAETNEVVALFLLYNKQKM